jgi:hypothetical protein
MMNIGAPTMPAAAPVRLARPMQTQRRFAGFWRHDRPMPVASRPTPGRSLGPSGERDSTNNEQKSPSWRPLPQLS